jgi:hydrogenase expression/formation protein HypE
VANEGLFLAIVSRDIAAEALELIRSFSKCDGAAIIGSVTSNYPKKVIVKSGIGGKRVVSMMIGEQLPRIC